MVRHWNNIQRIVSEKKKRKNQHPACEMGQKPTSRFQEHPQVIPDSSPTKRLNVNARDEKKADSVTETIRSV